MVSCQRSHCVDGVIPYLVGISGRVGGRQDCGKPTELVAARLMRERYQAGGQNRCLIFFVFRSLGKQATRGHAGHNVNLKQSNS